MGTRSTSPAIGRLYEGSPHDASPWILGAPTRPGTRLRLFCFPFAGGGASFFRPWADGLPTGVTLCPVQLPGRESRWGETLFRDIDELVAAAAHGLAAYLDRPFALFGHSMGGLLAYEMAWRLEHQHGMCAQHVFISATRPPHLADPDGPLHTLPKDRFIDRLLRLNGIPSAVLANREYLELVVPILRADIALCESYDHQPRALLSLPVTALAGQSDPKLTPAELETWRLYTSGSFQMHILPGDHFFVATHPELVLRVIGNTLGEATTHE